MERGCRSHGSCVILGLPAKILPIAGSTKEALRMKTAALTVSFCVNLGRTFVSLESDDS